MPLKPIEDFVRSLAKCYPMSRLDKDNLQAYAEELERCLDPSRLAALQSEIAARHDRMPSIAQIIATAETQGALRAQRQCSGDVVCREETAVGSCPQCRAQFRWKVDVWLYPGGRELRTVPGFQPSYVEWRSVQRSGACPACLRKEQR